MNRSRCRYRPGRGPDPGGPVTLAGAATALSSDASAVPGIFGLGFQINYWRTSDGQRHIVYNRGTLNGAGVSLQLATSADGITWTNVMTFSNTDSNSNADVVSQSSTLYWIAYSDNAGGIKVARLTYAGAGAWTVTIGPEQVTLPGGTTGKNPSVVVDANPSVWVGVLLNDGANNYLNAIRRTGAATYVNSGSTFGTSAASTTASIRLVKVPGGLFAVFTDRGQLNYTRRNTADATVSNWTIAGNPFATLYTDSLQLGTYQSEFSTTQDSSNNLHIAYSGGGRLLNFRWDSAGLSWTNQFIGFANGSGQPQAVCSTTDVVWLLTNDQYTNTIAYRSTDGGTTYALAATYTHPLLTSTVTYPNPHPQAWPPTGTATPGLLIEYTDSSAAKEKTLGY